MRVGRITVDGRPRTALIDTAEDAAMVLDPEVTVLEVLMAEAPERLLERAQRMRLADIQLVAPLDPPSVRDFSVFEQHIEGIMMGQGNGVPELWYESPFCYFSNPAAVTGPGQDIPVPPGCRDLDLELEVAVIVGKPGHDLSPAEAAAHIAGYTIFNDWSARDLQIAEMRLGLGICKGKDFANTLGPWVVTPDELEPYRSGDRLDLDLRAYVNGRELGDDTLANMAWSFEELLSYASRGTWLRPGDVIGSGTCGFGALLELRGRFGAEDYPWLSPGDVVSLKVEGIGTLTNRIVSGADAIALPAARPGRMRSRGVVA